VKNYFNYFTEIEEHFQRRSGGALLLSTIDWALIETWKDAGIPLEAVLRGIDVTFDHYDRRPSKTRKVNALGFCAQEVLAAAEDMKEASIGTATPERTNAAAAGFQIAEIAAFLKNNARQLESSDPPERAGISGKQLARETAHKLQELAIELNAAKTTPRLEELERKLAVLEERLFAALLAATSDEVIAALRFEADRELAPYRRKMPALQIEQLQKQYVHKRLLEKYGLPRLSLFYM
jgi:DNA-binding transcriptional MerR regulator